MNDFEALGLAYRASVGQHIAVVLRRPEEIRLAAKAVATQADYISDQVRVVTKNGDERVQVGRGEVVFSFRKSKRLDGYRADWVLTDVIGMSEAEYGTLEALVGPRGGSVVTR